jgi:hypothetical protein
MSDNDAAWHGTLGLNEADSAYMTGKGAATAGDFIESYRTLERYQGNSIALPGDDATAEDWGRIHNRLGRPETAEDYDFGDLSQVDDRGKAEIDWFRNTSHELGLSQKQAGDLLARFSDYGAKREESDTAAGKQAALDAMAGLHAEWGPEKDKNTALANRAIKALGLGDDDVAALTATAAGKVALTRAMARIAPKLGEDTQIGKGRGGDMALSKADAKTRITAIYGDPEHPYHKAGHPGHRAAVDTMAEYFQAANREEAAA